MVLFFRETFATENDFFYSFIHTPCVACHLRNYENGCKREQNWTNARNRAQIPTEIDNDENKMINDTQFKSIIYLGVINGERDK